jgi:AraC-like DNA-binding protein
VQYFADWNLFDWFLASQLGGAGFAIVLGLAQYLQVHRTRENEILGALLCVLALPQIHIACEYLGVFRAHPYLFFLQPPLNLLAGPLTYAYFHRILEPAAPMRAHLRWTAGALALAVVGAAPLIQAARAVGIEVWNPANEWYLRINLYIAAIQGFVLVFLILTLRDFYIILRNRPRRLSPVFRLTSAFVALGLVILGLLIYNQLSRTPWMLMSGFGLLSVFPVLLFWAGARHPAYFSFMQREVARGRYERSRLKGLDAAAVVERLRELMEFEALYADEDLSLARLATELNITAHQLSEILNTRLNRSFKNFINEHRVLAACRLLAEEPDRSILSISGAVGFASKSSFNAEFFRVTGKSPTSYRKSSPPIRA